MSVEFVGIELELRGADGVYSDLEQIDRILKSFRGKQKVDAGMTALKKDIVAARGELEKLQREQKKWQTLQKRVGRENMSAFGIREMERNAQAIETTKHKLKDLQQAQREVQAATRGMGRTFKEELNAISSSVGHVGSAMQSLGNALVRLTSPMRTITTGLLMGVGYKALNTFTEGLSGSFGRADTMTKYVKLMKEYETATYSAAESRDALDDSIQGLPIALDEAMSLAQRYTLSVGDMERGTQLAIATNNAFLASMATESQRYQGMLQLQDLMNGKDLTSREWMSLGSSMGKAINEIGLKLGYGRDELGKFRQDLYAGKIASKDFLDALIAVGTGEGSLVTLARASAETWEGLFSNAKIAVSRMGANIIDTLNSTVKQATGRTLLQQLLGIDENGNEVGDGIKHWIDNLSSSIQGWIKAHPEEIVDFFKSLRSIDWAGLLKGFGQGALQILRVVEKFANWASGKDLSKVGKFMVWANVIGNGLLILGGALKGTRHIWGFFGALTKFAGKGGLIGGILDGLFGKGGGGALGGAGGAIGAGITKGTFAGIGKIGLVVAEITGIIGAITTIASAFAALDMKLLSSAFNSFKEITANLNAGIQNLAQVKETEINMDAVKDIIGKISQVHKQLESANLSKRKSGKFAAATENIRDAIWQLRRAAYQINQAAGTTVDTGGFAAFVEQIKTAVEELKSLSQTIELDIKVVIGAGFASSVKGVVKKINDGGDRIKNAVKKIPNSLTRHVSVTITASVNTRQAVDAITNGANAVRNIANNVTPAMGGTIYRARGGNVPFRRRGTDTVPAMLTPGEYVHNKRAVSLFGIDFMRKVNNLDVKGAMAELMYRAGNMANVNRGASITNNYNNNQKVIINNNGNTGAGFTFKTASRFVGAI